MITINKCNSSIFECIGEQNYYYWKKYKEFAYTLKKEVPEGLLWYNLLSREMILLSLEDIKSIDQDGNTFKEHLVKKWFFIPEDIDDKTIVYSFWQNYKTKHPLKRNYYPLALATIFTTTYCNAQCPYCYEYGTAKNTMSQETAQAAADYIIRNAGKKIMLKWFGGEPLLNPGVIDTISKRLKEANIDYYAYMVSNAYLFDKIEDDRIKNLWKVNQVQITIDGTRENYLRIKKLPDDSYDKALYSIERLSNMGIQVMVRLHVTNDNANDIKKLVNELSERFKALGNKKSFIKLYATPLFEGLGKIQPDLDDAKRKMLYDEYIEIDNIIMNSGIDHGRGIPGIRQTHCMADNRSSIVITPEGNLTPCEHCHDREIIGNVSTGGKIPKKWFERTPETNYCAKCFYYPQCLKLKMCEAESPCNEEQRRYTKHSVGQAMIKGYENYKAKKNTDSEVQKVIKIAKQELGYKSGNMKSKYFSEIFNEEYNMPWCLPFIEWAFIKAYGKGKASQMLYMPSNKFTYSVPALVNLIKQQNQWFYNTVEIGYLIFLRIENEWINHVELVISVDSHTVACIGGNCGGMVQKNVYKRNDTRIAGYGKIIYGDE